MVNPYLMHRRRAFRGFAPETTTLLAAFTGSYDAARKTAINDLIVSLKNNGIWAKLDVLCIAGLNQSDSLVNWKNAGTFNGSAVSNPTFAADRGFTGNGSSSYIDTNFNLATSGSNFTQNSNSTFIYSRTNITSSGVDFAIFGTGSNQHSLYSRFNSPVNIIARANTDTLSGDQIANSNSSGFFVLTRTASSVVNIYRNGSSLLSMTTTSISLSNFDANLTVGAGRQVGTNAMFDFTTRQYAAYGMGGGFNATEASNFNTALTTYLTYIGANV